MVEAARKNKRDRPDRQPAAVRRASSAWPASWSASGRLGKIKTVKVGLPGSTSTGRGRARLAPPAELDYDFWLGPAPQRPYNAKRVHYLFRFFWDYSGGQMTNFGAHHLDIAQWGLGMDESGPVAIEGTARFNKDGWYEVPEQQPDRYTYADGVKVICGQGRQDRAERHCSRATRATISVDRGKIESNPAEIAQGRRSSRGDVHLYASKNHHENWLDCIKTRELPICDVAIGHRSATVCHLGNIAVRTGRKIRLGPGGGAIVGDAEAARMLSGTYRKPWELPSMT